MRQRLMLVLLAAALPTSGWAQTRIIAASYPDIAVYDQGDRKVGTLTAAELVNQPIQAVIASGTRYQVKTRLGAVYVRSRDVTADAAAAPPAAAACANYSPASGTTNLSSNGLSAACRGH